MTDIIQFPNSKNITQPKPVDVLDHVISTLEALPTNHNIGQALGYLRIERRLREMTGARPE